MSQLKRDATSEAIPADVTEQAMELSRTAEILPEGPAALARKIHAARQAGRPLRVKLGIDPTSTDLHLGHAVVFRKLRQFQDFGHQVVLIIGGFTAQIGDPSGRNTTRPPLTPEQVAANAETYINQMGLILDVEKTEVVNNADWLAKLDLTGLLKLASFVTANQLLAKEAFGDRLDKQLPVGFHELFYPLLQAYDSVAVRADVELGGTDQRFNILQGRELQPSYGQEQQIAYLVPLLEGTDGVQKMSKSYGNYVGLKEPPDDMFGKFMRIPDGLIVKYLELATTFSGARIDEIKTALDSGGNPKDAKQTLARQVVEQYHGKEAAENALGEWRRVHSERLLPETMPLHVVSGADYLFRIVVNSNLASGSSEAKRLVQEGAVRLDGEPVKDPNHHVSVPPTDGVVLQVGRRKFVRLVPPS